MMKQVDAFNDWLNGSYEWKNNCNCKY